MSRCTRKKPIPAQPSPRPPPGLPPASRRPAAKPGAGNIRKAERDVQRRRFLLTPVSLNYQFMATMESVADITDHDDNPPVCAGASLHQIDTPVRRPPPGERRGARRDSPRRAVIIMGCCLSSSAHAATPPALPGNERKALATCGSHATPDSRHIALPCAALRLRLRSSGLGSDWIPFPRLQRPPRARRVETGLIAGYWCSDD
ncbi:hypothetical protein EYF80_044690 [Liparis tanakae]|uniref:Uncharacterized protein n=1 Tax=Liparis tanakae TaxID=230148 RepID=A0A4Z2FV49_9TELE|nr:hypothetical protein EYF80_044690 [Liparis tanakae]